jgi:sugar/nucleoside kinase (ribokinase family)
MGELLVEIMRPQVDMSLHEEGEFRGPFPSGAPAIFIDTAARLGHPAGIIGGVAQDDFGRCLLDRLRADGVNTDHVLESPDGATAVAFVTYRGDGSRQFIYHIDGTPAARAAAPPVLPPAAWFHVMGCSLMVSDAFRARILDTMNRFHEDGAQISFDPNIRPELLRGRHILDIAGPVLERCSVLLPGTAELALLSGRDGSAAGVAQLFAATPLQIIVVKHGSRGSTVYTRDDSFAVPAYPVTEVDPTGAGDCFDAAFLAGLLEGRSLPRCAQMAAAAGALNAAAFGPMEGDISPATVAALIDQGPINR